MKNFIVICFCFMFMGKSIAAVETFSQRIEGNAIAVSSSTPVMTIMDDKYYEMASTSSWPGRFKNFNVKNFVRFGLNPESMHTSNMSGTLTLSMKLWKWNATSNSFQISTVSNISLAINYSSIPTAAVDEIASYLEKGAHKVEVYITAITGNLNLNNVFLSSEMEVERYYTLDQSPTTSMGCKVDPTNPNYLIFDWDPIAGAEFYEIEYVHLNNLNVDGSKIPPFGLTLNFYLNSTRISVKGNSYRIPKIFNRGYLVYRVRAVGNQFSMDIAPIILVPIIRLDRVEGPWSAAESGYAGSFSSLFEITSDYDPNMNWVYQVGYGDNGERFEGVSFSDGLGRARQNVAHNTVTGQAIVSNVYYDELGRPVLSDLPTPVDGEALIFYPSFNKEAVSGLTIRGENLDKQSTTNLCRIEGIEFSGASGAAKYYSPLNPNQVGENALIPDAEKYPYSRIEFKNDYTGRIARSSAAGKDLKAGGGHETMMVYPSANQEELDQLFGAEVGKASHYQKIIERDANGQLYVRYLDMAGRVIASALAGEAPTSLDPIEGNGVKTTTTSLLPLNAQNVVNNPPSSTLTYTEYLVNSGTVTFNYAFTPLQYKSLCVNGICFDCVYDLTLDVVDECGVSKLSYTKTLLGKDLDDLCTTKNEEVAVLQPINLMAGEYTITKKLSVNQQAIDDKWCTFIANSNCTRQVPDFFNQMYVKETFESCKPDLTITMAESESECDVYKASMLADMMPGGQYATYNSVLGVYTPRVGEKVHSIFTSGSLGIAWNNPSLVYKNADGSASLVNGVTPQNLSFQAFILNFRSSWAEALLPYHPEYCFYADCIGTVNQNSGIFDNNMLSIATFTQASANGYFRPLWSLDPVTNPTTNIVPTYMPISNAMYPDPYFATGTGLRNVAEMYGWMKNYQNSGFSIYEYAIYLALCNGTGNIADCISAYKNMKDRSCYDDLIWINFRKLYLELKRDFKYKYRSPNTQCTNDYIGKGTWSENVSIFGGAGGFDNFNPNSSGSGTDLDSDGPGGTDAGTPIDQDFLNGQANQACDNICQSYADNWIDKMVDCEQYAALNATEKTRFKSALVAVCKGGCTANHPFGATTSPAVVTVAGKSGSNANFISVDDVMLNFFGAGYEDDFCTSLLIDEPGPYVTDAQVQNSTNNYLDTCICKEVLKADNTFTTLMNAPVVGNGEIGGNPYLVGLTVEKVFAHQTGVFMEDINYLICACKTGVQSGTSNPFKVVWNPGAAANWQKAYPNIDFPQDLGCVNKEGCAGTDQVKALVSNLQTRLPNVQNSTNYSTILTNYLNNSLNYHLTFVDYNQFIGKYSATTAAPYCEINPQMNEWADVMKLITFRGQLLTNVSASLNLMTSNIVFSTSTLKDRFASNLYWSTLSADQKTLSTYFGASATSNCNINLILPATATFKFKDIVSFGAIQPLTSACSANNTFRIMVGYLDCGIIKYAYIDGISNCMEVNQCICTPTNLTLCDDFGIVDKQKCYQPTLDQMYAKAITNYLDIIPDIRAQFKADFNKACAETFKNEKFSFTAPRNVYQFTLYFYDQAGNLVKTVAPQGVDPNSFNTTNVNAARSAVQSSTIPATLNFPTNFPLPTFTYETKYKYNSYNQLVETSNPDQIGSTFYFYDRYGRIAASQNPVQLKDKKYSYCLYDVFGRPVEVGQVDLDVSTSQVMPALTQATLDLNDYGTAFKNWVYGRARSEVTFTIYDKPMTAATEALFANGKQENTRLRVASVVYFATVSGSAMPTNGYQSANHYSYDIHGNVIQTIQDVPVLAVVQQHAKSTQYKFELISGNVKKVEYQKGKADKMTHSYYYDKLNRLSEVYTSTDEEWHQTRDAHYRYFDYGPLARVEYGKNKVQGMDYAYTINGWIKGVNSNLLNPNIDAGRDGAVSASSPLGGSTNNAMRSEFARDVIGYSLGYFQNDYNSIGASSFLAAVGVNSTTQSAAKNQFWNAQKDLFNGNISYSVMSISGLSNPVQGYVYQYDQLNRLKGSRTFLPNFSATANNWGASVESNDYKSSYKYDRNGNLTNLTRTATGGVLMDNFAYSYLGKNGAANSPTNPMSSNRLDRVQDVDGTNSTLPNMTSALTGDIEGGMVVGNYKYDELGQLISDTQSGILAIEWRKGDKKMLSQSTATTRMECVYNPFGQRVMKIIKNIVNGVVQPSTVQNPWLYTYYAYDANGQVMATYKINLFDGALATNNSVILNEQFIYGMNRVGLKKGSATPIFANGNNSVSSSTMRVNQLGNTQYELTNYLGNVNAVISDRKMVSAPGSLSTYEAVLIMACDYYPFGMEMPGRNIMPNNYRFGYNGMEKDSEMKGEGNSYTTEFRQYDPRLGRWLSLDPLMESFPDMSPFVAFDNNPIFFTDPMGLASCGPGDEGGRDFVKDNTPNKVDTQGHFYDPNEVTIKGEKSCSNASYRDWITERGGIDAVRTNTNLIYNQKLKAANPLGCVVYGNDAHGTANLPEELKNKYRVEAEKEAINSLHTAFAMDKSGVDPNSFWYTINPFKRSRYMYWRALAVSSRSEGTDLISETALNCTLDWLGSRGFGVLRKAAKPRMNLRIGRAAYRAEVKNLKNVAEEMALKKCSSEEIARKVHQMRRDIGIKYKNLTSPELLENISRRNIEKYGDKLGPTIDYLRSKGLSWEEIIDSSARPGGKDLGL